ncbi:M28 family peptidase [Thermoleophilia bacterium SCSIO 60948]|nr:M28 family peptidase [Thermoleophilia bacterium SCSIO 60948]
MTVDLHAAVPTTGDHLDAAWHRDLLDRLCEFERETCSPGELEASRLIADELRAAGAPARLESEDAHGTYWWPLGIAAAAGGVAGLLGLRGHRVSAAALGAAATALMADEFPPGRRRLRSRLKRRRTHNVIAELGPPDAERTIVVVSHTDSAHTGLVFRPELPELLFSKSGPLGSLGIIDHVDTSPPLMAPVIGGPALSAIGALVGSRRLSKLGAILGFGAAASMAEIGLQETVPGANDNATGVVVICALARRLAAEPTRSTRVILMSAGAEESFSEGIKAFGDRHFADLPRESTFFLCVDTVGSPRLNVLRGEGFLRMREYPAAALELMDSTAERLGIPLVPNLRLRNGTDGLEPLAAGYPTATLCSVNEMKNPSNYHFRTDVPENVDLGTLAEAIRLCEGAIRRLDESWL